MSAKEDTLSHAGVLDRLIYDADTGSFYRRSTGKAVGYIAHKGYIRVDIGKNWYSGHRLAWFMVNGQWPGIIDHKNGNKADNRIENLREVDRTENAQNQRAASKNNPTGLLGVSIATSGRFRSQIRDPNTGRIVFLGTFDTADEAHEAYIEKKLELHPGYATGG